MISDVIPTLIALVLQSLWRSKQQALNEVSDVFQKTVFKISRQYQDNFNARHGTIKVLGMTQPINLDCIYVDAEFWDAIDQQHPLRNVETIEKVYRDQRRGLFELDRRRQSGIDVINDFQYLVVLGGPGTGKSTFLRKAGLVALDEKKSQVFQYACLPVFIELKELRFSQIDIRGLIEKEFEICGFPDCADFTEEVLEQGKLLILLDGLDEVPYESLNAVIREIQNFVDFYSKNRYIISCRNAVYRHKFKRFTDVTISQFGDHQILNFILTWFNHDPLKGRECWRKLNSPEYQATKELSHTPLLLTLLCMLYQKAGHFPTNRATLYEKAFRILLEEWSGEKGLIHEQLYQGLDTKRKEIMLSEIAFNAFVQNEVFMTERTIATQIEQSLQEMLPQEQAIDGRRLLKAIEAHHGILVEYTPQVYMFSHLTFQEFLTAQYIVDYSLDLNHLTEQYLLDHHWREVFLLLAGLKQADQLLIIMEHHSQRTVQSAGIQQLLHWADEATYQAESSVPALVRRAIALFLACDIDRAFCLDMHRTKALDLEIDLARDLVKKLYPSLSLNPCIDINIARALETLHGIEIAILIAQKFSEMQIFQPDRLQGLIARLRALKVQINQQPASPQLRRQVFKYMHQLWLATLGLKTSTFNDLTTADLANINHYLRAVLLIVECKQASVRVSHRAWSDIQSRLLRVNPQTEDGGKIMSCPVSRAPVAGDA